MEKILCVELDKHITNVAYRINNIIKATFVIC